MNANEKAKKTNVMASHTPKQKNKCTPKSISQTVGVKQTSPKGIKRKHNELESRREEILLQLKFLKNKIDDIYDKFVNKISGEDWKGELRFELKQENILDINDNYPKSLNTKGSHFLEYSKFWVLFIEMKYSHLDLLEIVAIFNNALQYEQNDLLMLYEYMVNLFFDNFEKEEILVALEKVNGKGNRHRVPENAEDLTNDNIKYLVYKPEIFTLAKTFLLKNNLNNNLNKLNSVSKNLASPNSGQSKKKFNPNTYSKISNNKDEDKRSPISAFSVFEGSFGKKVQPEALDGSASKLSASKIKFYPSTGETKFSSNFEVIKNEISTQTEKNGGDLYYDKKITYDRTIVNIIEEKEDELNYISVIKEESKEKEMKYSEIIERNKFKLVIDRPVNIELSFSEGENRNMIKKSSSQKEIRKKKKSDLNSIEEETVSTIDDENSNDGLIEDKNLMNIKSDTTRVKLKKRGKSSKHKTTKK
jgi:hypothetical protein